MDGLHFVLFHYAWLTAWLAACLAAGVAAWGLISSRETPSLARANPELALFFGISAGLALHIIVITLLAALQLLTPVTITVTLAVLTACALVSIAMQPALRDGFAAAFRLTWRDWLGVLPIALLVLTWVLRPLGTAEGSDSLAYHLPYARFYLENGGLAVKESLRFPLHTHNVNMLYAAAMIRPDATMPQMLHAWMGLLSMLGVYGLARHWHGWLASTLTAVGVLLSWEFLRSLEYAYADNGVMLFVTAAFLCMALWVEGRQKHLLWACAAFAGTAMGCKYFGALFTVPLGLAVLWFSRDFRLTVKFTVLTSAFGLFWYARAWIISGNPVHPFASDLFGHYIWTPRDVAAQVAQLARFGIESTWTNFFLLPERLFSERMAFGGYPKLAMEHVGVLIGAFMASCLLIRWQRPFVRLAQATCLAYLLFWFFYSQLARYLLITTPLMSLVVVTSVFSLLAHLGKRPHVELGLKWLEIPAKFAVLVLLLDFSAKTIHNDLDRIPLSEEKRLAYLSRKQPSFDLMRAAAADPRIGDGPILQFQLQQARYFFPGDVYGDWMGPYAWRDYGSAKASLTWKVDESEILYQKVIDQGFTAVAMRKKDGMQFQPQEVSSYTEHFEIVLENYFGVLMVPKPPDEY